MGTDVTVTASPAVARAIALAPTIEIIGATAIAAAGLRMMVGPPVPEPGYHLSHGHHLDVLGGVLVFTVGAVALAKAWHAFVNADDVL